MQATITSSATILFRTSVTGKTHSPRTTLHIALESSQQLHIIDDHNHKNRWRGKEKKKGKLERTNRARDDRCLEKTQCHTRASNSDLRVGGPYHTGAGAGAGQDSQTRGKREGPLRRRNSGISTVLLPSAGDGRRPFSLCCPPFGCIASKKL